MGQKHMNIYQEEYAKCKQPDIKNVYNVICIHMHRIIHNRVRPLRAIIERADP